MDDYRGAAKSEPVASELRGRVSPALGNGFSVSPLGRGVLRNTLFRIERHGEVAGKTEPSGFPRA